MLQKREMINNGKVYRLNKESLMIAALKSLILMNLLNIYIMSIKVQDSEVHLTEVGEVFYEENEGSISKGTTK